MHFKNRNDAARQLADRLVAYKGQSPLVLGVPRGAVPMARIIADALEGVTWAHAELDPDEFKLIIVSR